MGPAGRLDDEDASLVPCGGNVDGCSSSVASLKASAGGHSSSCFAYSPLYCTVRILMASRQIAAAFFVS